MAALASDLERLTADIERYVRPETFPVAIRLQPESEVVPAKARRPLRDLGARITICQAISIARRYGWTIALSGEDLSCPIAAVAFAYEKAVPYYTEGHLAHGMYTESLEAGARAEEAVPKLDRSERGTVLAAPLARAAFEPQVVVIYANPAQVMRLVAGMLYKRGGALKAEITPRADCAELIVRTLKTGEPQVILPCYGDRVFGLTQDHEMAFALPFGLVPELVEGLRGTHQGGVRYPIPTFLQFEATFPKTYQRLQQIWDEEKRAAGERGAEG